jgi:Flp pilus assembly protein TadD
LFKLLDDAARRDATYGPLALSRGRLLLVRGDAKAAQSELLRATAALPQDAEAHSAAAVAHLALGEVDDPRSLGNMGTALLAAGQVESAIAHLMRAHERAPERATFMSNLGYAHQLKGDLSTAESWCRRAIAADPKLGSAWINLGLVLGANKQWVQAERAFKEAQKLDPTDPRPKANLEDLKALSAQSK